MATAHPGTSILELGGFLTPILPSGGTGIQISVLVTLERTLDQPSVLTRSLDQPIGLSRTLDWPSLLTRDLKAKKT